MVIVSETAEPSVEPLRKENKQWFSALVKRHSSKGSKTPLMDTFVH